MKLIVACTPSGGIGYKNKLPWDKLQGDLPRFRKLTTNNVVVMGRNTWESLPVKPLPNRTNVVVTSTEIPGITTLTGLPYKDNMYLSDAWLIGGAKLINSSWHLIDEIHLTKTLSEYPCDTHIDLVKLSREFVCLGIESHPDHTYEIWKRN